MAGALEKALAAGCKGSDLPAWPTEHEKDLTDRLQSDLEYIAGWSLRRDIGIVLRTVRVLTHRNAF